MKLIIRLLQFLFFVFLILVIYCNSLIGVDATVKQYYQELKVELKKRKLKTRFFVISGRRFPPDNWLLNKFGGASSKSRHLKAEAIDIIILDVNDDGIINTTDVDLVYNILDKIIVANKGGVGTYKKASGFFSRQMIHFDCRGKKARWHY